MSWWVYLVTDVEQFENGDDFEDAVCDVDRHWEGGTCVVGGVDKAELNITYNYGGHFRDAVAGLEETGLKGLGGKRAGEWIDALEKAVAVLSAKRSDDYWEATAGNAGHALSILLAWAKQHPDAFFVVS